MARAKLSFAVTYLGLNLGIQVQQSEPIADCRPLGTKGRCDLLVGKAEVSNEPSDRVGQLDWAEILSLQILDNRELSRLCISQMSNRSGQVRPAGKLGRAPTTLARDEFIPAVGQRPHNNRLKHAVLPQAAGQAVQF